MNRVINIEINGKSREVYIDIRSSLLEVIREDLSLTGSKKGCGVGECGACSVLVDGVAVDSCIYLAIWADGRKITTIEGIERADGELSELQKSFVEKDSVQCGFCIPGFMVVGTSLLKKKKNLSRDEIRRELSGNLCRCTGYEKIIDAFDGLNKNKGVKNED